MINFHVFTYTKPYILCDIYITFIGIGCPYYYRMINNTGLLAWPFESLILLMWKIIWINFMVDYFSTWRNFNEEFNVYQSIGITICPWRVKGDDGAFIIAFRYDLHSIRMKLIYIVFNYTPCGSCSFLKFIIVRQMLRLLRATWFTLHWFINTCTYY